MLVSLLVAVLMSAQSADSHEPSADAPFTVVVASGSEIRVDIGMDTARSRLLRHATVVTPSGAVRAKLVRLERKCETVCDDDDPPVCHFEAVLRASGRADGAVGVLPGTPRIENVSQMKPGADQQVERPQDWVKAGAITDGTARYSWEQFPDGVFLTENYDGRPVYADGRDFYSPAIQLSTCRLRPIVPFTVIACGSAELLYEERRGIAASFAEYGDASVAPTVRFQLDGKDAVLIRFGIKGEMVVALLVRDQSGWQLKYRWADYPLMC